MTTLNAFITPFYIGTYTDASLPSAEQSQGIYQAKLDSTSGAIADLRPVAWGINAGFLAIAPNRRFLYAIGDTFDQHQNPGGVIAAFAIAATDGALTLLNQQATPNGGSCHVNLDASGRFAVSVSYRRGSFATYPIYQDGTVGAPVEHIQHEGKGSNPTRQEAAHAHQAVFSPDNRFLFVNDLGIDKVMSYRVADATGKLVPNDPAWTKVHDGAGPRHLDFHPNGKFVYLINELDATITGFEYEAEKGVLRQYQVISTLPAEFTGEKWCADIHVHPSGRFLVGSNRGHDSIAIYTIDEKSGWLTTLGYQSSGGKTPRNFAIDPTGNFLLVANQDSNNIVTLAIDQDSGGLTPTGHTINVAKPICIKM